MNRRTGCIRRYVPDGIDEGEIEMEKPMRYAYEVYKQKSFSRAAESLYISQPALSAIIRKLEESLDTPLFDRSTKPVSLTPAGEYYIHCAEQIMAVETGMEQYFDDMFALKKGRIRIGASTFFCSNILPELLGEFKRKYPSISIGIEEDNSTPRLKEKLLGKEIDFAISSNSYPEEDYESVPLYEEHIILAVPKTDPVNRDLLRYRYTYDEMLGILTNGKMAEPSFRKAPVESFAEIPLITIDKISDLYPRILNMFRASGLTPQIVMHLQQMSSCYYMAANGFGGAFLRSATLLTVRDTGNLYFYFPDSPFAVRTSRLYYKRGVYVSKAMHAFMNWIPIRSGGGKGNALF